MSGKVAVRVLSAFRLAGGAIAEPMTIVELEPIDAYNVPPGWGERLDPERARELIDEAARQATAEAARKCGPVPRSQALGEPAAPAWHVRPAPKYGYLRH
jgi:hypothetical protein